MWAFWIGIHCAALRCQNICNPCALTSVLRENEKLGACFPICRGERNLMDEHFVQESVFVLNLSTVCRGQNNCIVKPRLPYDCCSCLLIGYHYLDQLCGDAQVVPLEEEAPVWWAASCTAVPNGLGCGFSLQCSNVQARMSLCSSAWFLGKAAEVAEKWIIKCKRMQKLKSTCVLTAVWSLLHKTHTLWVT